MSLDDLRRALRPLSTKLANMIGLGTVKRVDDSKEVQELQLNLLEGETRDEVERLQQYGLTSNPPEGSECLVVFVGGRRDQAYCLAAEKRGTRIINLQEGEVALYSKHGQMLVLKANGDVEITPKSGQKVKLVGDTEVTGTLTASADVVGGGISLKTHTHAATLTVSTTGSATAQSGTATGDTEAPTP